MYPIVSIIIVNFNSGDLLRKCLASIVEQTFENWEVIIVDNASGDDSLSGITLGGKVSLVRNKINKGFAASQNQGIHLARGQYLLPLNFDVIITPTFLYEMTAAIEIDERIGSATCKLLYMNEDGFFSKKIYAVGHELPPNRFPILRGTGEEDTGQYDRIEYVFGAPGAAPMYRREALEDVAYKGQFFDESFFMWCEDVDLDWRLQTRGWKCIYTHKAVAYHIGHPGGYPHHFNTFRAMHSIKNRWAMVIANEFRGSFKKNILSLITYELSLLTYVIRHGLFKSYIKAFLLLFNNLTQVATLSGS